MPALAACRECNGSYATPTAANTGTSDLIKSKHINRIIHKQPNWQSNLTRSESSISQLDGQNAASTLLFHDEADPSQPLLGAARGVSYRSTSDLDWYLTQQQQHHHSIDDDTNCGHHNGAPEKAKAGQRSRFRFLVAILVVSAIAMNSYANYTMYIAAIEMISNDVISTGMTELRAKHMSLDPLAVGSNAGAPGTCPVETKSSLDILSEKLKSTVATAAFNATAVSQMEQHALAVDTLALMADVDERLANGQLVDWTIEQRGLIFTAHTIGGILLAIPIGRLSLVYGSKTMISSCILLAALRMWLFPILAGHTPFWFVFIFELTLGAPGLCIAILAYPIASAWLLPSEANFFVAIAHFALLIGNAATNFISTQMLSYQIDWTWCYYLPAAILSIIAILWIVFGADKPDLSKYVSQYELKLLENSTANLNKRKLEEIYFRQMRNMPVSATSADDYCICMPHRQSTCPARALKLKPNWRIIFTCPTVWALIGVFFSYHWNAKIATMWPTYFSNILHLDAQAIGIITGLKGIVALLFGSIFAYTTRGFAVRRPFGISLTAYRRVNQVLATSFLGLSVALMVLMDCSVWANFTSVLLTPVVSSFNAISHEQMPLDLSAEDSGLLVSVIRCLSIGDIPALPASSYILSFAPNAVAGDRFTWRLVWLVGLLIKVVSCSFFIFVAKSQPKSYSRLEPTGTCTTLDCAESRAPLAFHLEDSSRTSTIGVVDEPLSTLVPQMPHARRHLALARQPRAASALK